MLAPAIVVEKRGVIEAFERSRALVKGHGWQVFGVIVVLFLLQLVIGGVVQAIFRSASDSFVVYSLADLIVRVIIAPLSALAAAVMFFELKRLHGEPVRGGDPAAVTPPAATPAAPPPAPEGQQPGPPPTPGA